VLTWWQGQVVEGHGQGVDVIESDNYAPVATVHAGNGLYADLHDFEVTPREPRGSLRSPPSILT